MAQEGQPNSQGVFAPKHEQPSPGQLPIGFTPDFKSPEKPPTVISTKITPDSALLTSQIEEETPAEVQTTSAADNNQDSTPVMKGSQK